MMEEHVTPIREDLLPDVRKLVMLIGHHEQIIASIKAELVRMLQLAHGINMEAPGTILDAESGVVVQRQPEPLHAAPAPSESQAEA